MKCQIMAIFLFLFFSGTNLWWSILRINSYFRIWFSLWRRVENTICWIIKFCWNHDSSHEFWTFRSICLNLLEKYLTFQLGAIYYVRHVARGGGAGGANDPPRFWQNSRCRITTYPPRFSGCFWTFPDHVPPLLRE